MASKRKGSLTANQYWAKTRKGKKLSLTRRLLGQIKRYMALGGFEKVVFSHLGIPHRTWYGWKALATEVENTIEEGGKPKSLQQAKEWEILLEFLDITREARPKTVLRVVTSIEQMIRNGNFQAAKFYLQTVCAEEFGEPDSYKMKHDVDEKLMAKLRNAAKRFEEKMNGKNGGNGNDKK